MIVVDKDIEFKKSNSIYFDWYFAIWWQFTKNKSEILNVQVQNFH